MSEIFRTTEAPVRKTKRSLDQPPTEKSATPRLVASGPWPQHQSLLAAPHRLWDTGHREEAVESLEILLRSDHRLYLWLAVWLLDLDRVDDFAALLRQYEGERSVSWAYSKVLLAFRQTGGSGRAERFLEEARRVNRHVPACLLDDASLVGRTNPTQYEKASIYASAFRATWTATSGALAWLRQAEETALQKHRRGGIRAGTGWAKRLS
jgi:hypothetical protein